MCLVSLLRLGVIKQGEVSAPIDRLIPNFFVDKRLVEMMMAASGLRDGGNQRLELLLAFEQSLLSGGDPGGPTWGE